MSCKHDSSVHRYPAILKFQQRTNLTVVQVLAGKIPKSRLKNSTTPLYLSSPLLQPQKYNAVDTIALMCHGVPRTDSSRMYSLIVMNPQLPYSCPIVQTRETRQTMWEKLKCKSSSNNWLLCECLCVTQFLSDAFLSSCSFGFAVCLCSMYVLWQW